MRQKGLAEPPRWNEFPSLQEVRTRVAALALGDPRPRDFPRGRSGGRAGPADRGGASAWESPEMPAARPGEAGKEAELFPRPVAEDARLGWAAIAVSEKGSEGPPSPWGLPRSLPKGTQRKQRRAPRSGKVLGAGRGKRASYLARLAGVGEGVDVLGAEVHYAAVDAIEIGAPGRVVGVAAREGRRGAPGCRRPQEPGQRAEQGEPRAAGHGGRRARRAAEPPWGPGERRAGPSRAPPGPGAGCSAARPGRWTGDALGKHRANIQAAARGLRGRSRPGVRGREIRRRGGYRFCSPASKSVSCPFSHF